MAATTLEKTIFIAEKVMGWTSVYGDEDGPWPTSHTIFNDADGIRIRHLGVPQEGSFDPFTDHNHAAEVVAKMIADGKGGLWATCLADRLTPERGFGMGASLMFALAAASPTDRMDAVVLTYGGEL